jgi:hypothetical protein
MKTFVGIYLTSEILKKNGLSNPMSADGGMVPW